MRGFDIAILLISSLVYLVIPFVFQFTSIMSEERCSNCSDKDCDYSNSRVNIKCEFYRK